MQLDDKTIVITGSGSGIGRATALLAASRGAAVVVSDVDDDGGYETERLIRDKGGVAHYVHCDVSNEAQVQNLMEQSLKHFGTIDCAVNNAGIAGEARAYVSQIDGDEFDRLMQINVRGVWLCMKYQIPPMLKQGRGAIVNISSVAGLLGAPGMAHYAASKHAVLGLTKTAALEVASKGIRVNAICPSYTDTPMVNNLTDKDEKFEQQTKRASPMRRWGQVDEIAEGILWLCSDAASFVNGHHLTLDGGLVAM